MDVAALQEEIDEISTMMYQNREQEAFARIGDIFGKLKKVTDDLLYGQDEGKQEATMFISCMYRNLSDAYQQKDMLGMADCFQEYASLAVELYKTNH